MKWLKEIKAVGIRDWLWFVVYLKRDEFSHKLDLVYYWPDLLEMEKDRKRAHEIDMRLSDKI